MTEEDRAAGEAEADTAEAEALERLVEEEDVRLRLRLGGYAALVAIGALFLLAPFLSGVRLPQMSWRLIGWTLLNVPLLVLAAIVLRRGRLPLGRGRFLEGASARRAVIAMLLVNLFLFFGPAFLQWIVDLLDPPGW